MIHNRVRNGLFCVCKYMSLSEGVRVDDENPIYWNRMRIISPAVKIRKSGIKNNFEG